MRKLTWIIVGCLCVGLIAFGVTSYGDNQVSAEVSKETKGSFVRIEGGDKKLIVSIDGKETTYPLAASAWVYRNMQKAALTDLKPGDTLDVILNSKDQAAYIKASSADQAAAAPAPAAAAAETAPAASPAGGSGTAGDASGAAPETPAVSPAGNDGAGAAPAAAGTAAPAAQPTPAQPEQAPPAAVEPKPAASAPVASAAGTSIERLSLEWKSSELMLQVKQDPSAGQGKGSELYVQTKDKAVIHLTGASADALIQQWLRGLPTERQAFEQALKQRISSQFQLKDARPEWKLDVKWREDAQAPAAISQSPKAVSADKSDSEAKWKAQNGEQEKGKNEDKENKGKDKGKDSKDYKEHKDKGKEKD